MCAHDARPELIVVADVEHYRRAANSEVAETDLVLEIGCSTGQTTAILADRAARVVAVDCSVEVLDKARDQLAGRANVELAEMDARDVAALTQLAPDPDAVFLDVGGNALADNVAGLLRQCLLTFSPRLIVVRSFELAEIMSLVREVKPLDRPRLVPRQPDKHERSLQALLDMSRSDLASNRLFAARKLRGIDAPAARERLAELASDPSPQVRRAAGSARQTPPDDS